MTIVVQFLGATLFAFIFAFVHRFGFLRGPRGKLWLAAGAGVAVAYVFVDLLPHLAKKQALMLAESPEGFGGFLREHPYLPVLAGVLLFQASGVHRAIADVDRPGRLDRLPISFRLFKQAGYVLLVSYLLTEQPDHRLEPGAVFTAAMAMHLVGLAHFLWHRHGDTYSRLYRFAIVGAVYAGWLLGLFTTIPAGTFFLWYGFLGGSIISITLTHEVAEVESPRAFFFFALGTVLMAAILLGMAQLGAPSILN